MEFSEIFSFLIILKESIKLVPKNAKSMASIAILSLILPSVLLLLFSHFDQSLTDYANASFTRPDPGPNPIPNMLKYLALLILVEFAFLLVFFMISHISGIATILVSSASYKGSNLSSKDLFSSIKRTVVRLRLHLHCRSVMPPPTSHRTLQLRRTRAPAVEWLSRCAWSSLPNTIHLLRFFLANRLSRRPHHLDSISPSSPSNSYGGGMRWAELGRSGVVKFKMSKVSKASFWGFSKNIRKTSWF